MIFVADSKLVKIDGETATIYLDGNYKELFWETNLKNALITASFEVYNTDLKFHFVLKIPKKFLVVIAVRIGDYLQVA